MTALFTFPYSDDFSGVEIRHFDFGRPVLDFVVGDDGVVVVSLDGQWSCDDPDAMVLSENSLMVRTVQKCSSGEVCEFLIRHSFLKLFLAYRNI